MMEVHLMKYPILLLDLDNTILDTKTNAEKALQQMSKSIDFPFNNEQIQYWHLLNDKLWEKFERDEITRPKLLTSRFELYFEHYNRQVNVDEYNKTYLKLFKSQDTLIPHAKETLQKLKQDHHLFAISNGTKEKQYNQLTQAHLINFFDKLYLSEDIGFQKPDPAFFEFVIGDLKKSKSEMLVIGDSLTADISGANAAKIDNVWFDPQKNNNPTNFKPTYEINDLRQLISLSAN